MVGVHSILRIYGFLTRHPYDLEKKNSGTSITQNNESKSQSTKDNNNIQRQIELTFMITNMTVDIN